MTLCRHVARKLHGMHLGHANSLPFATIRTCRQSDTTLRCGCPLMPQPPQEPLLRVAVPYAAGGAALAGPGCPLAKVSLYPPRRLVAGGGPSQKPERNRKKIDK